MKKQINEIAKLKRIAGLITESEYQEEIIKDEEKVNEVYGLENDDLIYDNMVTMDIEQLVSDMLSTVEKEPSSTLKDYVLKYDSSEDDNDDYDTDYKEPNEPFDMAEAKAKVGGINERLQPHVYERMYNLSNIKAQQAMIRAAEILMRDLTEEGFEVPEIREFFTQLIANDI